MSLTAPAVQQSILLNSPIITPPCAVQAGISMVPARARSRIFETVFAEQCLS